MSTTLEEKFLAILNKYDIPIGDKHSDYYFSQEYEFSVNPNFRFDFAWIKKRIAVEIQGGIYGIGGHNSIKGIERDYKKLNYAQTLEPHWRVIQFSAAMLRDQIYVVDVLYPLVTEAKVVI